MRDVSSVFISTIIRSYLTITVEMGNLFTTFRSSDGSSYWKKQSIDMLALLASDKSSLKLYQAIPITDLKKYMKMIVAVMDDNFFI